MSLDDNYLENIKAAPNVEFIVPASQTANEFNNVNVRKKDDTLQLQFTLMMDPQRNLSKPWKTAIALDASASMRKVFGRRLTGDIPATVATEYEKNGWLKKDNQDGRKVKLFTREAVDDAVERGLISFSPNLMDYLGPEFIGYLSRNLDIDDETTLIYWAGGSGAEIEVYGDIKEDACAHLSIDGPEEMMFGKKTQLLPALKFLVERFEKAHRVMLVFFSDGRINDLSEVKQYTVNLARLITDNQHNLVKCILIGVGDDIDETPMLELDALAAKTYVNIWDHMIVNNLQEVLKIFAEVIRNTQIVAGPGTIYDADGNILKSYPGGLPATVIFSMPITSPWFELELADQRIRQTVEVPKYVLGGQAR